MLMIRLFLFINPPTKEGATHHVIRVIIMLMWIHLQMFFLPSPAAALQPVLVWI